jgi:hypothetical protein
VNKKERDKKYREENRESISVRTAKWRAENRDKVRAIQKRYYRNNKETCAEAQRIKNRKNPQAVKARTILNHAIQLGRLERQPCFICGEWAEAHHPCYELPLDVAWLCPVHHKEIHFAV